jgi:uncharacterized membrane protein
MEDLRTESAEWWKRQRTNYVYIAMASGILAFLAYASIWETFHGTHDKTDTGLQVVGSILLLMLMHLVIWVPLLAAEVYAYRFLPKIDQRMNPSHNKEKRMRLLVAACVAICFLPMILPAMLVILNG